MIRAKLRSLISSLPRLDTHDRGVEKPGKQQDEEEVDDREGGCRPQVETSYRSRRQELAEEGGGIARSPAGQDKGFGIDQEGVHEAQQDGDGQNAGQLWKLDIAEDRPAA